MSLPPEIIATIEAMPDAAAFIALAERIEGPAHLYLVTWHLMRGDGEAAHFCASIPSSFFHQHDDAIRLAFAAGYLKGP